MITATLHKQVVDTVVDALSTAQTKYKTAFKMPSIVYTKRGTTAGTADYTKWEINLNPVLLVENVETFLKRTVIHEVAHLVHFIVCPKDHDRRYGKRDVHGTNWQRVMSSLGGEDVSRCHSYDVSSVMQNRVRYAHKCSVCGNEVQAGPKYHSRIENGERFFHKSCGRNSYLMPSSSTAVKATTGVSTPTTSNKSSTAVKTPAKGSKIHQCYEMYKMYHQKYSRSMMINVFVQNCDCTPAGASTYYQTCKKMYDAGVV